MKMALNLVEYACMPSLIWRALLFFIVLLVSLAYRNMYFSHSLLKSISGVSDELILSPIPSINKIISTFYLLTTFRHPYKEK